MSNGHLNWAWEQIAASDLEKADALIVLCLADMANKLGEAWPSVGYLAKRTNLDPKTVYRSITIRLIPKGLIERTRRGKSWLFTLLAPCNGVDHSSGTTPDNSSGTTPDDPVDKSHLHRASRPTNGKQHRASRPVHRASRPQTSGTTPDKPLLEPKKEPLSAAGTPDAAVAPPPPLPDGRSGGAPSAETTKAPASGGTTNGSGAPAHAFRPPGRDPDPFAEWVGDGCPPDKAIALATPEPEVLHGELLEPDETVGPKATMGVVRSLGQSLRHFAIPEGPELTRNEQLDALPELLRSPLQPREPERTPAQQIAELLGISLAAAEAQLQPRPTPQLVEAPP